MIKKFLKPFIPEILWNRMKKLQIEKRQIKIWNEKGCPAPPPHKIKQKVIAEYQRVYKYDIFLETGTFLGDMVEAQKGKFKKIISIELGIDLFKKAQKRFENNKRVTILQGDSGKVLPEILKNINEPIIFWLDGHYSAGVTAKGDKYCPIYEEMDAIFNGVNYDHVLLIDDARCFNGKGDYPTIERLTEYVRVKNSNYHVEVKHDIIRYVI